MNFHCCIFLNSINFYLYLLQFYLYANAKVAKALGSIPESSDTWNLRGWQMNEAVWNKVKREGKNFPFLWSYYCKPKKISHRKYYNVIKIPYKRKLRQMCACLRPPQLPPAPFLCFFFLGGGGSGVRHIKRDWENNNKKTERTTTKNAEAFCWG